jgi:hypothetical protein
MKIKFNLKDQEISILLLKNQKIIDQIKWQDNRDLLEKLLPQLDKLLKKNKLKTTDIQKFDFKTNFDKHYSSYRILKATVETLNLCREIC